MTALKQLPMVWLVQDNEWDISAHSSDPLSLTTRQARHRGAVGRRHRLGGLPSSHVSRH